MPKESGERIPPNRVEFNARLNMIKCQSRMWMGVERSRLAVCSQDKF